MYSYSFVTIICDIDFNIQPFRSYKFVSCNVAIILNLSFDNKLAGVNTLPDSDLNYLIA